MLTRRDLLRAGAGITVAAAAIPLLGACTGGAGASSDHDDGDETVDLQVAWWGSGDRTKRTQKVLSLFEQKYKNTKISAQFSSFSDYWQRLDAEAAGVGLPDILQMDMAYIGRFTDRSRIADLTRYKGDPIDLHDFDKNQLAQGTVGGKLRGVPLGGIIPATIYNTAMLDRTGLPPLSGSASWGDYAEYCRRLGTRLPKGVYPSEDPSGFMAAFEVWVRQHGTELWTADGQAAFNINEVTRWFQLWDHMRDAGLIVTGSMTAAEQQDGTNQGTAFARGRAAFILTWSNFLGQYQVMTKDKLAMRRYPTNGPITGDYVKASQLFSLSEKTANGTRSATFVNFFIHDPDATKVLGVERGVPGSAATRTHVKPTLAPYDVAQIEFYDATSPRTRARTVPDPPGAGEVGDALTRAAQSIALAKQSPAQAAAAFLSDARKALGS